MARAAAQVADGSEASCTSPLRWGGCWSWSGLARYTAICRGPQTAAVLQAYEGGGREGFRECRRAQERSRVELPDLPGPRLWFAWGR